MYSGLHLFFKLHQPAQEHKPRTARTGPQNQAKLDRLPWDKGTILRSWVFERSLDQPWDPIGWLQFGMGQVFQNFGPTDGLIVFQSISLYQSVFSCTHYNWVCDNNETSWQI